MTLEHSKITPPVPVQAMKDDVQMGMEVEYLFENTPVLHFSADRKSIVYCFPNLGTDKSCWPASHTTRVDQAGNPILTLSQQASIGSLTTMPTLPWWLWRTESLTYGEYNNFLSYLQKMLFASIVAGLIVGIVVRVRNGGWFWQGLISAGLITPNALYLLPGFRETPVLFSLMMVAVFATVTFGYHRQKSDLNY